METINVKCAIPGTTGNNWPSKMEYILENVIIPKMDTYNNLSYIGNAYGGNNGREVVYSINGSLFDFLRIGKTISNNDVNNSSINCYVSKSNNLNENWASNQSAVEISNYGSSSLPNRIDWNYSGNSDLLSTITANFILYSISDTNSNLKVLWAVSPTISRRTYPNPLVFTKTHSGRNIAICFRGASDTSNDNPTVIFLDDSNRAIYYLKNDTRKFSSSTEVIKISGLPITTTNGGDNIIDSVDDEMVQIVNMDLRSINGDTVYNNGGYVRKLIRIGNKYYRQLTSNWWFEDPKGDEPVEYVDETTYSS